MDLLHESQRSGLGPSSLLKDDQRRNRLSMDISGVEYWHHRLSQFAHLCGSILVGIDRREIQADQGCVVADGCFDKRFAGLDQSLFGLPIAIEGEEYPALEPPQTDQAQGVAESL